MSGVGDRELQSRGQTCRVLVSGRSTGVTGKQASFGSGLGGQAQMDWDTQATSSHSTALAFPLLCPT